MSAGGSAILTPHHFNFAIEHIEIIDKDVRGPAYLAVAGMLREKQRKAIAGDLREHREAGFEAVIP